MEFSDLMTRDSFESVTVLVRKCSKCFLLIQVCIVIITEVSRKIYMCLNLCKKVPLPLLEKEDQIIPAFLGALNSVPYKKH